MKNDKICIILSSFSKEELKSFEKFIISPYFAHRRDVSGYFKLLKSFHPEFDTDSESFYRKLFPGETFNERKLKNLGAELVMLAEQFLAHEYTKTNEWDSQKFLTIQYKNRKLYKYYLKAHKELEAGVKKRLFNSFDCFNDTEELDKILASYYVENNQFSDYVKARSGYTGHFTVSFIVRYLKAYTDNIILQKGYGLSIDNPLFNLFIECMDFEKLIGLIEKKDFEETWLIRLYYYGFMAHKHLSEKKYFESYKNEFYKNANRFSRLEKHFLFSSLTDLHLMRGKYIKDASRAEIFEINKRMLSEDAYSPAVDEYMDIVLYRNILLLSLELNETGWTEGFINVYSEKIMPKYRFSAMCYAKAWLYFVKGECETALNYTNKINYDFFLFKIDVKMLMLGIYYELNLFDQAFSLIDAYKHYVAESSDLTEVRRIAHNLEIKQYTRLLKAKTSGDHSEIGLIAEEFKKTTAHIFKNWILKKSEEIIKKGAK